MPRGAVSLTVGSSTFVGAGTTTAVGWPDGGRTSCVINASAYGTISLQLQGPSGVFINIASSFVADQVFTFDAPAGQYRLNNTASSTINVVATLIGIPYNQ